jgi:hypothetical protein
MISVFFFFFFFFYHRFFLIPFGDCPSGLCQNKRGCRIPTPASETAALSDIRRIVKVAGNRQLSVGMGQTTMTNASNSQTFRFSFFGVCNAENEIYT